jgi:hypothetical protein
MRDFLIVTGGVIILCVGVGFIAHNLDKISCRQKTISFSGYRYGLLSGCMVLHNERWLPLDNIRAFDDKR